MKLDWILTKHALLLFCFFSQLMIRHVKKSAEEHFRNWNIKILTYFEIFLFSDMDGLGSPDSLMEHSMLDIKNSSPYACYSPKLSYEVFPTNRGKQRAISKSWKKQLNSMSQVLTSVELKTKLSGIWTRTTPATVDLQVITVWPMPTSPLTLSCNLPPPPP